jgi:hypothetical protein
VTDLELVTNEQERPAQQGLPFDKVTLTAAGLEHAVIGALQQLHVWRCCTHVGIQLPVLSFNNTPHQK